jgi:hypothetical protein
VCRLKDQLCAREIDGKRFFEEDRFSEFKSALGNRGLEIGRHGDGNCVDLTVLHQLPPSAEGARHVDSPSETRRPSRIGSR